MGQTASGSGGANSFGSKWDHTATSGKVYSVFGQINSTSGGGLYGLAYNSSGSTWGVIGQSKSPSGIGVFGYSDVTTGSAKGVEGRVKGPNALGVYGVNEASSGDGVGVYGINKANSGEGAGILGYNQNASSRWAGQFWAPQGNGVSISSAPGKVGLVIYQGSKNAAVDTNSGIRLLYSEESTEVWFSDYGFGQIVHGKATILIDPIFADTVNLDEGYHVFLQAYSDATIYVTKQNETVEAFVFSIGYAVCCRYSPGCNQPLGYSG